MSNEISTNQVLLISKQTESRRLAVSNLPDTATEEKIKECFQRFDKINKFKKKKILLFCI
jgi:RNA recognition motif-containing protein